HRPENEAGLEHPTRARTRKRETAQGNLEPPRALLWRAGRPPRGGAEGRAEHHRVVIEGSYPTDEAGGQSRGNGSRSRSPRAASESWASELLWSGSASRRWSSEGSRSVTPRSSTAPVGLAKGTRPRTRGARSGRSETSDRAGSSTPSCASSSTPST